VQEKAKPFTGTLNLELNEMVLAAIKKGVASILDYSTGREVTRPSGQSAT
jgi:hypothetical protein